MTKLLIVSDSHDHIDLLRQAIQAGNELQAAAMLHCGDLCAPFMLDLMGNHFKGPIHVVLGNNDGDGRLLQTIAARHQPTVTLHGIYAELTYGGRSIAMIHYPEPAYRIAQSAQFSLVCYGHDHTRRLERIGSSLLLNPGEIMGMKSTPSWAIYDCENDRAEIVEASRA